MKYHVIETIEYDVSFVHVFSKIIEHEMFIQYSLKQGLKLFEEKAKEAAFKVMNQLHLRNCLKPLGIKEMSTETERKH